MKGSFLSKFIIVLFLAAVCAYFGVQGYRYLVSPQSTAMTYAYETEDAVPIDGYVVRDETVIEGSETLLEITHAEGERVAAGRPVATVFRSQEALERTQELHALNAQLEQLQYALSAASDAEAALKLDSDIADRIAAVRAALASGNYSAADELSAALKTTVMRRSFAYNGTGAISERIAALKREIASISSSVSGASSTIYAPFAGTYSAVADGYESVLRPDTIFSLTPDALDALHPDGTSSAVGKLIAGDKWYFVAAVREEVASQLKKGQQLSLRMVSGVDHDLPVTVQSVSDAERGRVAVVFRGDRYLSDVTLLRFCRAELILRSFTGLRIPKNALRLSEDGQTGVYCRIGLVAYFKPVEVLYQGEDYLLVEPGEVNIANASAVELRTLRAGDELIISAGELYEGKVVE